MHEERIQSTAMDKISTVTFLKPYSNIFAPVCHSVHRGESASVHAGIPPKETPRQGDPPPLPRRPPAKETPPTAKETPRRLLLRAVRILLECILVITSFSQHQDHLNGKTETSMFSLFLCILAHLILPRLYLSLGITATSYARFFERCFLYDSSFRTYFQILTRF